MATTGIANTPLINYFRYKQSTIVSSTTDIICYPVTSFADAGNGQLVLTTTNTENLEAGTAITIMASTLYDGNYTVISVTPTTINVSGDFIGPDTGTWELSANITGANAGDPLDFGTIAFFDNTDQVTPLDTYADRDLTVPNPNPITLDAVGSYPPIYLLDQPYYIEIKDKFNNVVETLEDYLPGGGEDDGQTDNIENLFPSYGFESQVDNGNYSENVLPADTPQNVVSAGWFWEISTTQISPANTYTFNDLGTDGIIANPKNELILNSTNNTSGDALNNLGTVIGDYNSLQGLQLALSVFVRTISGSVTDLPVQLRRTNNGVNESPIAVGNIPTSSTRTQQIITFTVPAITDETYVNGDKLELLINLPLNTDFSVGFTGMWLQESNDGTVTITEIPISISESKQYFGNAFRDLQDVPLYEKLGLPLAMINGSAQVLNQTGTIFAAPKNIKFNYAESISEIPGKLLLRDEVFISTSSNRLIDLLRKEGITSSRNTLIATPAASVVTVTTGIGTTQLNPSSASGTNVTISKTTDELEYGLSAVIDFHDTSRILATFNDQFEPSRVPHPYSGLNAKPNDSPIVSWFGDVSPRAVQLEEYILPIGTVDVETYFPECEETVNFIGRTINSRTKENGSGSTNAQARLFFANNDQIKLVKWLSYKDNQSTGPSGKRSFSGINTEFRQQDAYFNSSSEVFQIQNNDDGINNYTYNFNYLSYNDISSNPSPQPATPVRVIRYETAGQNGANAPTGTVSTLKISIDANDPSWVVALKTSNGINSSWVETITVASVPTNGDYITFSLSAQEFIVIYFDTAQTKPVNPIPSASPIFVEYTTSQTTTDIATATAEAINNSSIGLPYAPDLGLPPLANDNLRYYIIN